ncbi:MAG: hypothetical protein V5A66_00115 [Candidatus Thermoplasmatota archaeon]
MTKSEEDVTVERVQLKPEWLDGSVAGRQHKLHFYSLFLILSGILSIAIFFSGGHLKQLISLSLIAWVSIGLLYISGKEAKKIEEWKRIKSENKIFNLPLKRTSSIVERAVRGRILSQVLIEKRIREALMEKIKNMNSLSEKELKALFKNPSALRELIGDETLSDFLMNSKRMRTGDVIQKKDEKQLNFKDAQNEGAREKGETYQRKIEGVIEKILSWEGNR